MTTKQVALYFLPLLLALAGCTVKREAVVPKSLSTTGPTVPATIPELQVRTVTGEWIAEDGGAGGTNSNGFATFKNFQYTLEVAKNNQQVDIIVTSADINVMFALFDPLGQQIGTSSLSRSPVNSYTVNAGTYRVAVCAARMAVGKFSMTITGLNSNPARIPSEILRSGNQNWGPLGGGGNERTFKNHFYTLDVTEDNTPVDFTLLSADVDVEMVIYNPLGQAIASDFGSSRYRFKIITLNKGTYTVMAATDKRGGKGNYRLSVTGKVANLKQVESQVSTLTGRWPDRNATDTYSIQLTPNTSPLDIELLSPDTRAFMELQTSAGSYIARAGASNNEVIVRQNLAKNTYRIQVNPPRISGGPGNYTLTVVGQFTEFKKL